jgi:hypothetical protein
MGGDDFPITIGVFLFSNYPARPFRLFLRKFTTECQNCRVVVWVRTSVAWCVVSWRGVPWRGVVWCHFMCQLIIPKFPFHIMKKTCTYIPKYQQRTCIDYITALLAICTQLLVLKNQNSTCYFWLVHYIGDSNHLASGTNR